MYLTFHGGKCCAIRHIHGFPKYSTPPVKPDDQYYNKYLAPGLKAKLADSPDKLGSDVSTARPMFWEGAPAETYVERLDRYLDFLSRYRPGEIVEVTLVSGQSVWYPILEERGFKVVNEVKNSNTGRIVKVFHKNMEY
jgi:hypothetical protein